MRMGLTCTLAAFLLAVASCNTIEGAGEDISAGGDAISGAANDVEQEISE